MAEDDAAVADDDENDSSSEGSLSEDEKEDIEDEEEEDDEEEEEEDEEEDEEHDSPADEDGVDGLEDGLDSDEDELTGMRTRVRRKNKSYTKPKRMASADTRQLTSEKVQLHSENREQKNAKEAETTNAFHYVTSLEAQELQRNEDSKMDKVVTNTDRQQPAECCKVLEKEVYELRTTVKEIKEVNHKWDTFYKGKKSEHDAKLKAKDDIISQKDEELFRKDESLDKKDEEIRILQKNHELERHEHRDAISQLELVIETGNYEREDILKQKDGLLLLAKERVAKCEGLIEELRRDLKTETQKSDRAKKFARNLLKQKSEMEGEIKRLNGTLEEKCEEQSLLKSIDPKLNPTEPQLSAMEYTHRRPPSPYSPPLSPTKMKMMEKEVFDDFPNQTVVLEKAGKVERQKTSPAFERQPPQPAAEEMSLTKDELKEQVELFREQTEAYESDFRRERRDREAVAGKLDSVKKELEKTKSKLRVAKPPIHVHHRANDKYVPPVAIHKDPKLHQLQERYRLQAAAPPERTAGYPHKRDHLIAHGTARGSKSKQRDRYEKPTHVYRQQPRSSDEEYEPELFADDDQLERCRCPNHDRYYSPLVQPMNNLSNPKGAY